MRLKKMLTSGIMGRGAISLLLATAGVNLSSFIFHVELSRLLGPADYGAVNSVLSILMLIAVPISASQLAVTQAVMGYVNSDQKFSLSKLTRRSFWFGIVAMGIFLSATPTLNNYLHLNSVLPMLLVAMWIPLATTGAVLQGALIGEYRFKAVAFAAFLGGGPIRLLFGLILVKAGLGVFGAVLATTAAQLFSLCCLLFSARDNYEANHEKMHVMTAGRDMILAIFAVGGFTALGGIDTFLARHFLSAHAAGEYAAGAIASHIALFAPLAIVSVAFPHLVENNGEDSNNLKAIVQASWLTAAVGLATALFLTSFAALTINVLFGNKYKESVTILGILSVASMLFGLINLLMYLLIARRSMLATLPWVGVALAGFFISVHHPTTHSIAFIMLVVSFSTFLLCAGATIYLLKRSSRKVVNSVR